MPPDRTAVTQENTWRYRVKQLLQAVRHTFLGTAKEASQTRTLSTVFEQGFHGDEYLLSLVNELMQVSNTFIETGTNVGTTAHYIASKYRHVQVYSCEPDENAFAKAKETTAIDTNVHLYKQLSPDFLYKLHTEKPELLETLNLYWLDAHDYGFKWPLHDEIRYITDTLSEALILVDDTKVPGLESVFRYCTYEEQECNLDYIKNALAPGKSYHIFYPAYTEHTSKHHPLIGTMGVLHGDVSLDKAVFEHFTVVDVTK